MSAGTAPKLPDDCPWLVAVCAGRWQMQGIRAARRARIRVFALDGDTHAPGLAAAERFAIVDIRDPKKVIAAVREAGIKPAGAIAFAADVGQPAVAELREAHNLSGPGRKPLQRLTNKVLQRRAWDSAGLPNPRWRLVRSHREVAAAIDDIAGPAIIKPSDSAGSRGVSRIDPGEPWRPAAEAAFAASKNNDVLVESLLPGHEYTVETFAHDGKTAVLAVTEKRKVPGSRGTVAVELATAELPAAEIDRISETACAALAAVDYQDGPGHVEVIYDPVAGPGLVEAAGRGAGFMMFDGLVPKASGYDLATACALQAVGQQPAPIPEARTPVALRFFPTRPGVVRSIAGFDAANRIPGIEAGPFVSVGQQVGAARTDGDRLGYILAWASSFAEVRRLADQAEALISFKVDKAA